MGIIALAIIFFVLKYLIFSALRMLKTRSENEATLKRINLGRQSTTVLVSRGRSFVERLPFVVKWIKRHSFNNITLLLCLEKKYTEEMSEEIKNLALNEFEKINQKLIAKNEKTIDFRFVSRQGLLQDNINSISKENKNVSVIFVGKKMLDYRLNEIKELSVPLFFIE